MGSTPFIVILRSGSSAKAREGMEQAVDRAKEVLQNASGSPEQDFFGNLASRNQAVYCLIANAQSQLLPTDPPVIAGCGAEKGGDPHLPLQRSWLLKQGRVRFAIDNAAPATAGLVAPMPSGPSCQGV
ncbi:hypothetical protein [Streptomyces sp. 1222.5]|uniref:hypothetical protein n=1 Tax=Streptomyces sp. 1222.5 TaxID=1881026 RepID=UPI003EBA5677